MYNYIRCLVNSIKYRKKFFTPVICDRIAACNNIYCTNVSSFWNNATCKRFYCRVPMQDVNIPTNPDDKNIDVAQQKLDEFLSSPDNKKFFEVLQLEVDVMRHDAEKVPDNINTKQWLELLDIKTRTQRKKYLNYLFLNERAKQNKKMKKEQKKEEWLAKKAEKEPNETKDPNEIKYGLCHNSLFLRIYDKNINHFYNSKLIWGMMFEPKVVFDCSYEDHMNNLESHNCAKQLTLAFAVNRIHENPMFLHFCNLKEEGVLKKYLCRNVPNLMDVDFPAVVTSQSYLDFFPKDQLVYLTPHCRTNLVEYDSDMVYIIGAMVDKSKPQPLSLAKAKKEGLRMARLPVEKYLDWGSGSTKNFTINQVLSIILDLRHTKSWEKALQHIPIRKLREHREYKGNQKFRSISKLIEGMESSEMKNKLVEEIQIPMKSSNVNNFTFATRKEK
ncbi:PREDICTED: mitochondrial ribonuclease P protein 1 homolog [Dinoponera quadriceps]|uniref:RNA (guanine-9-)-methyltransferase domain-containing protein 1 n=1 Tax=Dinoponera quadriceps TaxID=609295 RepID=A0A6P3YBI4_DINQU|nr:PREDICTED: mitochondrial ribonuclease P protein 1 homolog [Dinoponera quadriceps]